MAERIFDIIIVGGGPAGMTAALYAARDGRDVAIIEKDCLGGQAILSKEIENIPGFESINGIEWVERFEAQLKKYRITAFYEEVTNITTLPQRFMVHTTDSNHFARTIILANGVTHRLLPIEGLRELIGHGVSVCATCDGWFYHNDVVAVIGGGNTAAQDALLLSKYENKVYLLQNLPMLTCEDYLKRQVESDPNITLCFNQNITNIQKQDQQLVVTSNNSTFTVDGVFLAIGMVPDNKRFDNLVVLNPYGFYGKSIVPGVFTAGDCRSKAHRQITTACADGTIAALEACKFLNTENL